MRGHSKKLFAIPKKYMAERATLEKITCDKCGYDNETQRIFCHECGARLDRSAYLKAVEKRRAQEADAAPKRMRELNAKPLWLQLRPWIIVLVGPPVLALLLMLFMDPVKPVEKYPFEVTDAAMNMNITFDDATFSPGTVRLPIPEEILNAHLGRRIKPDQGDGFWEKSLQWAVVDLEDGSARVTAKRKFYFIPMAFTGTFTFENTGQGIVPKVREAKIGKLPLPSIVFSNPKFWFGDVISGAKISDSQLKKVRQVKIEDDVLRITVHGN